MCSCQPDSFFSFVGWASTIMFNESVRAQFDAFYKRKDTFSLGVCNGCQLMALLGWVGSEHKQDDTSGMIQSSINLA